MTLEEERAFQEQARRAVENDPSLMGGLSGGAHFRKKRDDSSYRATFVFGAILAVICVFAKGFAFHPDTPTPPGTLLNTIAVVLNLGVLAMALLGLVVGAIRAAMTGKRDLLAFSLPILLLVGVMSILPF